MDIYSIHEAFVYKWTNTKTNKIYIGKHKGSPDDGYISSGKVFLLAYHTNPDDFERTIIWQGSNSECLQKEWEFIQEAVSSVGWSGLYNLTHWMSNKQWKRTCLHCGKWCDPNNDEWAEQFEKYHFENCLQHPDRLKEKRINQENKEIIRLAKEKQSAKKLISDTNQRKYHLSLCWTNEEVKKVKQYYYLLKLPDPTVDMKKEIIKLKKWIDKTL